jgi:hypothetical protein
MYLGCGCQTIGLGGTTTTSPALVLQRLDELTRHLIASASLTGQDAVVLNEVFNDDARNVFVNLLAVNGPYKHYVSSCARAAIGSTFSDLAALTDLAWASDFPLLLDVKIEPLDSGLMIFSSSRSTIDGRGSRRRRLPAGPVRVRRLEQRTPAAGLFRLQGLRRAAGTGAFASRVGLVKIQVGGPSYGVHLQSDEDSDGWPARQAQLATIRDVIVGAVPPGELSDDGVVFLAGDLNTYAYHRKRSVTPDTKEWHTVYNPASPPNAVDDFFACGNGVTVNGAAQPCRYGANGLRALTDSWGFRPTTEGYHRPPADHILHSSASAPCMQHAMTAWDLQADPGGNGGKHWLSDHDPIRVDFNRDARSCSPNDDKTAAGRSRTPGSLPGPPTATTSLRTEPRLPPGRGGGAALARIQRPAAAVVVIRQAGTYSTTHAGGAPAG